jgi:hypothetical protein
MNINYQRKHFRILKCLVWKNKTKTLWHAQRKLFKVFFICVQVFFLFVFFFICVNFKRTNIYELGAVEGVIWSGQILTGRTATGRNPYRKVTSGRNPFRKVTSGRNNFLHLTKTIFGRSQVIEIIFETGWNDSNSYTWLEMGIK